MTPAAQLTAKTSTPLAELLCVISAADFAAVHPTTVRAWLRTGVKLPDGSKRLLAGVRVGGRWRVGKAELMAFVEVCTRSGMPPGAAEVDASAVPRPESDRSRRKRYDSAMDRLRARGVVR